MSLIPQPPPPPAESGPRTISVLTGNGGLLVVKAQPVDEERTKL
jgi:hypothetical protein